MITHNVKVTLHIDNGRTSDYQEGYSTDCRECQYGSGEALHKVVVEVAKAVPLHGWKHVYLPRGQTFYTLDVLIVIDTHINEVVQEPTTGDNPSPPTNSRGW